MSTTAEKLTYLGVTKEKIRDSINLTGANIGTSDTFRSYASKLKLGLIDIINNGTDTLYSNFPKVSGIGSNLSLTPTYEAPMKLNEIQGDTLQDGTPTPSSPVPIQSVTRLQNVEVCGKNLISSISKIGNNIFFNGTSTTDEYVFKAGTYIFNYVDSTARSTYIKSSDGKQTYLGGGKPLRFTSNLDFNLRIYGSGITLEEISNVQLEKGSTATTYEPYKGNTYEVNLGNIELNEIGDYQDRIYKDTGKWYIEKNIGKIVLNGTEEWSTHQFGTNSFQLSFPDVKSGGDYITILSSHFKGIPYTNRNTGNNIIYNDAQSSISLIIRNTGFATLNDFKTWLSTHNTEVLYVLNTPTYTEITNTELIEDLETLYTAKSQEGTTNISITSEDLEMILNISALEGDE